MKNFIQIIVCLLILLGIYWGYEKFQILMQKDDQIKKTIKDIPSSAADEFVIPVNELEKGKITGTLGYPSEGIPELTVYAIDTLDKKKYFKVDTIRNQTKFTINAVDPGSYFVVASAKNFNTVGSYTKAVICGLSIECTDHSMIDVVVSPGKTADGVMVTDWYAPPNTFPKQP